MKAWIPAAFAAGLAMSASASDERPAAPRVDVAKALLTERIREEGPGEALGNSLAGWTKQLLEDPASPYTGLVAEPAFLNEFYWPEMVDRLPVTEGQPSNTDDALAALGWDLGLTGARPGVQVPFRAIALYDVEPLARMHRDPLIVAGLVKAAVDADIFEAALRVTTEQHSAVAASYAVAAQMIRDQSRRHAPTQWKAMGIRLDVVDRLTQALTPGDISDHDREYLGSLAGRAVKKRSVGMLTAYGLRELPATLRVARVAAAYNDGQGSFAAGQAPCFADGTHRPGVAGMQSPGDTRRLCFADATDASVQRWYADEMWRQVHDMRESLHDDSWAPGLFRTVLEVMLVVDIANAAVFVEKLMADDLVTTRVISDDVRNEAAARGQNLTCRMP